ncbi:MAG: glycosyltransferase family 9 protein [Bacteroidales bacterium]|jgi:ADP-heptose:LPS heptosyltransferase|nr:glycosyltransferase family 9 protein [Bacteroidales bacterium]
MSSKKTKCVLIIRLSALGDVAIAAPLIRYYAENNPDIKFIMLSQPATGCFFEGIRNLEFVAADIRGREKRLPGLLKFCRVLEKKYEITHVADLHDVIRSRIIRNHLYLRGIRHISIIDKGRSEKKAMTRRKNKILIPLETSMRRYEDVLCALRIKDLNFSSLPAPIKSNKNSSAFRRIGFAPFASHRGKCWPKEYCEILISLMAKDGNNNKIILFGGGKEETSMLEEWADRYPNTESSAGRHKLNEELELMKSLDVMVTMDSANMHLASFAGTPVVSIWGATHPYAGFYGYGQPYENAVQTNLECRPCSVFGNKKCFRGDYACMRLIKPENVLRKIYEATGVI